MQQHIIAPGQMLGDLYLLRPIEVEYQPRGSVVEMRYSLGRHTVKAIGEDVEAAAKNMLVNLAAFYGSLMRNAVPKPVPGMALNTILEHHESMRTELSDFIVVRPVVSK